MKAFLLIIICLVLIPGSYSQKYFQFRYEDLPRSYIVYTPRNFQASENLPLVINMHGFSTDAAFHMDYTQYNKTADTARCIVVYPNGWEKRWSTGTTFGINTGIDDVGFLSEMMDRLIVIYNIDERRIYATGYSAGGFMSYKLGCDLANRIASIAPNAGNMTFDNYESCVPARNISLIAANGTADAIVPPAGIPGNFPRLDSVIRFWQQQNGCDISPVTDTLPNISNTDGSRVVRLAHTNCSSNVTTTYYRILNGGHTWPGAEDIFIGVLGKTNQDISWNNTGWGFFKNNIMPQSVVCDAPENLQATAISADSFQLSWTNIAGADTFKIALIDSSNAVAFYKTVSRSLGIKIDPGNVYRWNVASICPSGFRNWNMTIPLQSVPTLTKNNSSKKLALFPNPAGDFIQTAPGLLAGGDVKVMNLLGQQMADQCYINGDRLYIHKLPVGLYQLHIQRGEDIYAAGFVKH